MKVLIFLLSFIAYLSTSHAITYSESNGAICVNTNDSKLQCWGDKTGDKFKDYDKVANKKVLKFKLINNFGCAILKEGNRLQCWGSKKGFIFNFKDKLENLKIKDFDFTPYSKVLCVTLINNQIRCFHKDMPINKNGYKKIDSFSNYYCGLTTHDNIKCWGDTSDHQDYFKHLIIGKKFKDIEVNWNYQCGTLVNNTKVCWGQFLHKFDFPIRSKNVLKIDRYQDVMCILYYDHSLVCQGDKDNDLIKWESLERLKSLKVKSFKLNRKNLCITSLTGELTCLGLETKYISLFNGQKLKSYTFAENFACVIDLNDQVKCKFNKDKYKLYLKNTDKKFKIIYKSLYDHEDGACFIDESDKIHCLLEKESKSERLYVNHIQNKSINSYNVYGRNLCVSLKENNIIYCMGNGDRFTQYHKHYALTKGKNVYITTNHICKNKLDTGNRVCSNFPGYLRSTDEKFKIIFYKTVSDISSGCVLFTKRNNLFCWGYVAAGAPPELVFENFGDALNLNIENNPYSPIRSLGIQLKRSSANLEARNEKLYGILLHSYINKIVYSNYSDFYKKKALKGFYKIKNFLSEKESFLKELKYYGINFDEDSLLSLPPTYTVKKEIMTLINNILFSTRHLFKNTPDETKINKAHALFLTFKEVPNTHNYKHLVSGLDQFEQISAKLILNQKASGLGQVLAELLKYIQYN